jgi:hypothetical protein
MRSISNIARRTHRRNNSNDSNTSSNNSPKSSSSSIKSPVWGRSADSSATAPLTSSSPSASNSLPSLSPRMWNRSKSKGISTNNTASNNNTRSLSPPRQSRVGKETISGGDGLLIEPAANRSIRSPHHRPQHSFDNNSTYNLATISENRRISSNTLNKITIKTPVSQLTKQLTESERSAQVRVRMLEEKTTTTTTTTTTKANNPYDNNNENENEDYEDCEICGSRGGCLSILNPKTFKNFFDRNSISIYSGRRSRKKQWKKTHH